MEKKRNRSGFKKFIILLLCVILAQGVITVPFMAEKVQAATVKKGLKKEGNYYYFYANNKKVTNTWKTIKTTSNGKTVSYKYYFGSNGRAYAAKDLKKSMKYNKNVVLKKIGNYYYGFDRLGHMVKSGYYNNPMKYDSNGDSYTYYFDKNGRCNSAKSKAIRKAGAYQADAAAIRKILGKPKKEIKLNSCYGEPGDDYRLNYANIYVTIHRYPDKREMVFGIFPM
ncbi:hypothetical protein NXH76_02990 [Blautia schinkii]|nr:hypothetical protein [Blautia schinkii]